MDERWDELLARYRKGILSAEERDEWQRLIAQRWAETPMDRPADHIDWEAMYARVTGQEEADQPEPALRRIGARGGVRLLRLAVAAVLIGLLGIGIWWMVGRVLRPEKGPALVSRPEHDALPGGNKAVLTLSGGRRVILDSAMRDTVLKEGAAMVASRPGQLAYTPGAKDVTLYNTLTTPRGGQYQLLLADGTKVWLNSASSITYPTAFAGTERRVSVTGEAYFEVPADTKPFRVTVDSMTIEVLGTRFNVNAYADEPTKEATLLAGKIRVNAGAADGISDIGRPLVLMPGQAAREASGRVRLLTDVDTAVAVAWKNGLFSFRDADVQAVMRQLARWYDVDVYYTGIIPRRRFDGKIGRGLTLDQVLKVLTKSEIHYTIENGHELTIRP
jgi:transmembrane sensor